jgi:hypothetical protein
MELRKAVEEFVSVLDANEKEDYYFVNRYEKMRNVVKEMVSDIENGTYPDDYDILPLIHYIDRNADAPIIYEKFCKLDAWYMKNYRKKGEAKIIREMLVDYLCTEYNMSQDYAVDRVCQIGRYKDIYFEFVDYVKNRAFKKDALTIEGYTAKMLSENYSLSAVKAYEYLIYLLREPQNALADLKSSDILRNREYWEKWNEKTGFWDFLLHY